MATASTRKSEPDAQIHRPTEYDVALAREASRKLDAAFERHVAPDAASVSVRLGRTTLEVPTAVFDLLRRALAETAAGRAVALHAVQAELSTQEAADLLGVSRPYLTGLLDRGEMPCRKVGSHRRVLAEDVVRYKRAVDEKRRRVLDELAAQAQELDMGY